VKEAVFVNAEGESIYVRARGHVTAAVCPGLKTRIFARLEAEPPVEGLYLDLSECEYMDSTFLGLIVGCHKRLSARTGMKVVLLGVNEACLGLLRTIGVLGLVALRDEGPEFPPRMEELSNGPKATVGFILDAHEDLSALSAANEKRFSALDSVLKSALKGGERD
jgi:anti-anti-sigma factor